MVRCGCDQLVTAGGIAKLWGWQPEGNICLVFSSSDLGHGGCFWPTDDLPLLFCSGQVVSCLLISSFSVLPNFASAHCLFSHFSCLLFVTYSYISYCSNLHSLTWPPEHPGLNAVLSRGQPAGAQWEHILRVLYTCVSVCIAVCASCLLFVLSSLLALTEAIPNTERESRYLSRRHQLF